VALAQDDMAVLNFVVIRDYSGKPIRNASVVMHPVEKNGKQSKADCKSRPIRTARPVLTACLTASAVQVLATGFQTFGNDYAIDKPQWITVRMKRPVGIFHYEDHPEEKKDQPDRRSSRTKIRKRSRSRVADSDY